MSILIDERTLCGKMNKTAARIRTFVCLIEKGIYVNINNNLLHLFPTQKCLFFPTWFLYSRAMR
jgi:hypothetical protein